MALKPETIFRKKVQTRLDSIENAWFESIQQKTICGTPDILGCVNGYFVGIEIKATSANKPTKLQEVKLRRIANAHGMAFVIYPGNLDKTIELLKELSRRHHGTGHSKATERASVHQCDYPAE